jgi:pSer/pThr/pTyr-binding forkhead associated (FHA) protein
VPADTRYALVMLEEPVREPEARFPLAGSVTVGRHLDNDLVIAGEDVRDFHIRIETGDRGPRVIALGAATVHLNRVAVDAVRGMKPGDELIIGHHRLRLELESPAMVCAWKLHRIGDGRGVTVAPKLSVGRATDCGLQLVEGHVSRHHAELNVIDGTIWLEDLGSSNGTFVNGDRVVGAWRIFHGDEVAFDTLRYQLIGDAPDLTPIRLPGEAPDQLARVDDELQAAVDVATAETAAVVVRADDERAAPAAVAAISRVVEGPALVGRSAPVDGKIFVLTFGRHLIGRGPEVAIHLEEASVSMRHAELDLRPDGAHLTNLISTNGTWVNGVETHTSRLRDGDLIGLGRVTLQYQEPVATTRWRRRRVGIYVGAALLAALILGLAWQWWLAP